MGQFLDYIASIFTGQQVESSDKAKANSGHHVTFADNSFTQAFNRSGSSEQANRLSLLRQSNRQTIRLYQFIVFIVSSIHFTLVTWPKIQQDTFTISEPEGWQFVTLNMLPTIVQMVSIGAFAELNKPLPEGTKITAKNSGLELNKNNFIHSLKVNVLLLAMCQLSSIFSDHLIWSVLIILPIWCYQLSSRLAQDEYNRHAPSPKKWVRLNVSMSKSPKASTPKKTSQQNGPKNDDHRATPRTRTRRAVKNIITGVSDKYHAFEQNIAHQISTKIFTPLSPQAKMIES